MLKTIRNYVLNFIKSSKNPPLIIGLAAGLYPFLKYYNSNFPLVNSVKHLIVFTLLFLIAPLILSYSIKMLSSKWGFIKSHQTLFFSLVNFSFFTTLVVISTWGIQNNKLLIALLLAIVLAFLFKKYLKKIIVFQLLMALLVVPKLIPEIYNQFFISYKWKALPDDIEKVQFKSKPNIYLIQPDGYVSKKTLENELYQSSSDLYHWLESKEFMLFDDFRSNYPSTLLSNASMFTMKHHYFGNTWAYSLEMPGARSIITGNNSVIDILKNNGYVNYFIVQEEYFQMNFSKNRYDYQNIPTQDISFFSGGEDIQKEVYLDLKKVLDNQSKDTIPKFFFIQKLMPHHVYFEAPIDAERLDYLDKIKKSSNWIKKTLTFILEKDPEALIIVLADHGGFVGMGTWGEFFSSNNNLHVNSIFSTLCAIKWGSVNYSAYDIHLKTNVNLFRVLFSALSETPAYLNYLEENSSYQLRINNLYGQSVYKLINDDGDIVEEKLEK